MHVRSGQRETSSERRAETASGSCDTNGLIAKSRFV
jgi:hypothetical protein